MHHIYIYIYMIYDIYIHIYILLYKPFIHDVMLIIWRSISPMIIPRQKRCLPSWIKHFVTQRRRCVVFFWERRWHLGKGVQNLWLMVWYGLKHSFGGDCIIIFCLVVTGTWSLLKFMTSPIVGMMIQSDELIFFRGWNNQPVFHWVSGHFRNRLIGGTYQEPLELPPF